MWVGKMIIVFKLKKKRVPGTSTVVCSTAVCLMTDLDTDIRIFQARRQVRKCFYHVILVLASNSGFENSIIF